MSPEELARIRTLEGVQNKYFDFIGQQLDKIPNLPASLSGSDKGKRFAYWMHNNANIRYPTSEQQLNSLMGDADFVGSLGGRIPNYERRGIHDFYRKIRRNLGRDPKPNEMTQIPKSMWSDLGNDVDVDDYLKKTNQEGFVDDFVAKLNGGGKTPGEPVLNTNSGTGGSPSPAPETVRAGKRRDLTGSWRRGSGNARTNRGIKAPVETPSSAMSSQKAAEAAAKPVLNTNQVLSAETAGETATGGRLIPPDRPNGSESSVLTNTPSYRENIKLDDLRLQADADVNARAVASAPSGEAVQASAVSAAENTAETAAKTVAETAAEQVPVTPPASTPARAGKQIIEGAGTRRKYPVGGKWNPSGNVTHITRTKMADGTWNHIIHTPGGVKINAEEVANQGMAAITRKVKEQNAEKAAEKATENLAKGARSWKATAAICVGAMALGAGLHKLLSNDRGQQSNAQLYGQQPLY